MTDIETEPKVESVLVASLTRPINGDKIEFELPAVIGRGPNATVKIFDNPDIDRLHCSIIQASGRQMIKDLTCNANAVFVNNKGLPSRGTRFIKPGAVLNIGNEDFVFDGLLSEEETERYLKEQEERRLAEEAATAAKAAEGGEATEEAPKGAEELRVAEQA